MRDFRLTRPWLPWLLALLLALALAACGAGAAPDEGAPDGSSAIVEAADAAAEEETPSPTADPAPQRETAGAGRASAHPTATPSPQPTATPNPARQVRLTAAVSLHQEPRLGIPLVALAAGQEVSALPTDDPLWYAVTLEDGTAGYLCGDCLVPVEGGPSLFEERFQETAAQLREKLPQDKYWNHMGDDSIPWGAETPWSVTDTPCDNWAWGERYCNTYNGATAALFGGDMNQCLGFASLLSDQFFGEAADLHVFYDLDLLRLGDHIRLGEYEHSMTVVAMDDEGVTVAECNENYEDCRISWDRKLSWRELENLAWDSEYISRYPLRPDGDGGFAAWGD